MTNIQLNAQQDVSTDDSAAPIEEPEASSFTMAELLGDPAEVIVHDRTVTVNGQPMRFHIKQLSMRECTEVDAKKYSARKIGQIERDAAAEEIGTVAWMLHKCVVKNSGTAESPSWSSLWSLEEIKGRPPEFDGKGNLMRQNPGLLGNPARVAQDLIDVLTVTCWEVNPPLNPMRQVQALKALGIG